MARPLTIDEEQALSLYLQHKNDTEIGQALKTKPNTIASWRRRKNLPSIAENITGGRREGIHYSKVLDPKQSEQMKQFLQTLLWAGEKAKEAGITPNIGKFIDCYAGRTKTQEEWKTENLWKERERNERQNKLRPSTL